MKTFSRRNSILLVLTALALLAVVGVRTFLAGPYLQQAIANYLAKEYDLQTSIGSYGGDLFRTFLFEDVLFTQGPPEDLQLSVAIHRLKVRYFLPALVRGLEPFLDTLVISVDGVVARINIPPASNKEAREAPFELAQYLPASLPRLQIDDALIRVQAEDFAFTSAQTSLFIGAKQQGSQALQLTFPDLETTIAQQGLPLSSLGMGLRYSPQSLVLKELAVNHTPVAGAARADFNTQTNTIGISGRFDLEQGGIDFTAEGGASALALQLHVDKWPLPAKLIRLAAPFLPPVRGLLTGSLQATMEPSRLLQSLESELSLSVESGQVGSIPASARLNGHTAQGLLAVKDLDMEAGDNRFTLSGASLPLNVLDQGLPAILSQMAIKEFSLAAADLPALQGLARAEADRKGAGQEIPPHLLRLAGSWHEREIRLTSGRLQMAESTLMTRQARLTLPASLHLTDALLRAELTVEIKELATLADLGLLPSLSGQVAGSLQLQGTLAAPQAEFSLTASRFSYAGYPAGQLAATGRVDRQSLLLRGLDVQVGPDQIELAGHYRFADRHLLEVRGKAIIAEIAAYQTLLNLPEEIRGKLRLEARQPPQGRLLVTARAEKGAIGKSAYDHIVLEVEELGEKRYQLTAEALATMGTAGLAGSLEIASGSTTLQLSRLSLARQERHLDLSHPATLLLDQDQQRLQIDNLTLTGSTETITIQGALGGALENDLHITATGLESRGWLSSRADQDYLFSGGSAKIAVTGTAADPRITATGAADRVEFPHLTAPLQGSFAFDIAKSGIVIHKFAWQNKNNQHLAARGQLPYDPFAQKILATPLDLQVDFNLPQTTLPSVDTAQEKLASGNITALLSLSGTLQRPQGQFTAEIKDLALPFLPEPLTHELFSARCNIRLAEDQLTIKTLQLEARDFVIRGAGRWTGLTDLGDLLATGAIHTLPGDLDIRLTTQMADIGWLTAKSRTIRRLKGQVEATLAATGPAADPSLSGTLLLMDGEFRAPTILPAMESIAAQVSLDGHTVQVENLSGRLGGAPFSLSGTLSREEEGVQVDARLEGENILFFRDQDMKIRGDTLLTLKGALAQMHLAGDIWLTDSRYTRNVDFLGFLRQSAPSPKPQGELFSLSEPPWRDMRFQVRIHSREPFELQNNLARGSVRPELLLAGTGELPVLTGEVYVDPIRIMVPAGRIMVDGGLIRFSQEQPDLPTFNLSGSARLAGYDISMQIQGTAAEPVIILSSIPPLPEDELLLLVLTGTPPSSGPGQGRESVAAMNMAIYLGRGLLADWFGGDPLESDESILDRFELNIGRSITRSGENTVEAQFRLADGILYPSDHLFLTSEKDVYDNFNAGIKIIFRFQ